MTATAHALVGGAIAASIQNPAIGITLAVASHPLLDMIPHWDFGRGWRDKNKLTFLLEGFFDLTVGLVASYLIFGIHTDLIYFLSAVLASLMLDFLLVPYWFFKWKFPPFSWVYQIQSKMQGRAKLLPWGIVTQIGTVTGIVLALRTIH